MKIFICLFVLLLSISVHAETPFNFARWWSSLGTGGRYAYLEGYEDAVIHIIFKSSLALRSALKSDNVPKEYIKFSMDLFDTVGGWDKDVISKVILSLYF